MALIKIFDRIHNLQTLGAKSPEKAKKILEETIRDFMVLIMFLGMSTIEQDFKKLFTHQKTILSDLLLDNQIFDYQHNSQLVFPTL